MPFIRVLLLLITLSSTLAAGETLRVCAREGPFFLAGDGQPSGVEYDLLRGFADSRKLDIEIIWAEDFASVFTMLEDRSCDISAARITRTEEREKRVDFSDSYFPVRVVLVVREGSGTTGVDQLAGKTLVVRKDTVYERLLSRMPEVSLLYVDQDSEMFEAVHSGQAFALAYDSAVVLEFLKRYPDLRIAIALSQREEYAFALTLGSPLRPQLDEYLASAKQDGSYRQLLVNYYGEELAALVLEP